MTLSPAWARLKAAMPDDGNRKRVYALMRYCSAKGIKPAAVDDMVLFDFTAYRSQTSRMKASAAAQRPVVRSWNARGHRRRLAGEHTHGAGIAGRGPAAVGSRPGLAAQAVGSTKIPRPST